MKRFLLLCLGFSFSQNLLAAEAHLPFGVPGYLTSSFGESRGTRYHAGIDYSTDMKEGFPVIAPENGKISQVRLSPYGYGKVVYFLGESGKTWVFAHQSGFSKELDSLVSSAQLQSKHNDIRISNPKIKSFRYGDTISFTGSSGIGNPHLHLELRKGEKLLNPCRNGIFCGDSLPPLILGAAIFQGEDLALTGENDLTNGCVEVPHLQKDDSIRFAFKIADYSRTPLENPMSVRRITLKNAKQILGEIIKDTLSFDSMIQIRKELLWAEEADTAGDWHFIPNAYRISGKDTLVFETEDMVGNTASRKFSLSPTCAGEKPSLRQKQRRELFSFLSRSWIGLDLCQPGPLQTQFFLYGKGMQSVNACEAFSKQATLLGKIVKAYPATRLIVLEQAGILDTLVIRQIPSNAKTLNDTVQLSGSRIVQSLSGIEPVPWTTVLAVRKLQNDTIPAYEFHPKGLHFTGDWNVQFDKKIYDKPLYYLGETSRKWFLFSKQKNGKHFRSARMNELRDIGFIQDTTPPELGEIRSDSAFFAGKAEPVFRIPVIEKESGIANGNAIRASSSQKPFLYAEFDSEPEEIVLRKSDLPSSGEFFEIQIRDEAGNEKTFKLKVP